MDFSDIAWLSLSSEILRAEQLDYGILVPRSADSCELHTLIGIRQAKILGARRTT